MIPAVTNRSRSRLSCHHNLSPGSPKADAMSAPSPAACARGSTPMILNPAHDTY